jgi:hypothetical protein
MIFAREISGQLLSVECTPGLQGAAEDVLITFASLTREGNVLQNDFRIRFGWSLLTLRSDRGGLRVCEPHFTGDPFKELNSTLDITLNVLADQVALLRMVGEEGVDVRFDQQIVFAGDSLTAKSIYALRTEAQSEEDSGWSVAPVPVGGTLINTGNLSVLRIYELIVRRPVLLQVMTLPVGYLATVNGDRLVEVTGPDGEVRWSSHEEEPGPEL